MTLFDDKAVKQFVKVSGVAAVLGYRRQVDWLESASFDVVLLPAIAQHAGHPKSVLPKLLSKHGDLARHLDFVVGTASTVYRARPRRATGQKTEIDHP